jgi:hypothetical protein
MPSKSPDSVALEKLKRYPSKRKALEGKKVRIWNTCYSAWWRPEGCGYTQDQASAGIYDFKDAWRRSSHAGPEKGIVYEVVDERPRTLFTVLDAAKEYLDFLREEMHNQGIATESRTDLHIRFARVSKAIKEEACSKAVAVNKSDA